MLEGMNNGRKRIDMHLHTIASDGTWTCEELIELLKKADIEIFSVTDHESLENVGKLRRLAVEYGLKYIPGVEISTSYDGYSYHILGFGINEADERLLSLTAANAAMLEDFDRECVGLLEKKGYDVNVSEFDIYEDDPRRGGWKSLNYLIDKSLCTDHKGFFKLFEEDKQIYEKMTYKHPKEVIETIIGAGGVPILAHSGAGFYDRDYKRVVSSMISFGVKGVECYHPENSQEITDYCLEICREKNLLITGGSDCHGDFAPARRLCLPEVYLDMLELGELVETFLSI